MLWPFEKDSDFYPDNLGNILIVYCLVIDDELYYSNLRGVHNYFIILWFPNSLENIVWRLNFFPEKVEFFSSDLFLAKAEI